MRNIEDIAMLCGPLFGPNMLKLLEVMRTDHGYNEQPIPNQFAQSVIAALPGDATAPSTAQCPEGFASEALTLLAYEADVSEVQAASREFQERVDFHFNR